MRDLKFTLEGRLLSRDTYFRAAIFSIDQVKIHDRVYMVYICFKELLCHSVHITKEEAYFRGALAFETLQYYFKYAQINQPMCLRMSRASISQETENPETMIFRGGG